MSYTLATVLVSLSLPAIALAIIFGMERRREKLHGDTASGVPDPNSVSGVQKSGSAETVAHTTVQAPQRKRAG
jgi:hypothetical protein